MRRALPVILAFPLGILLAACPAKGPKVPAACTVITEDNDPAEDHCSKDKADCETTLSKILYDAHENRCATPPCSAYSAYVDCTGTGDECELGDGSFGQRFATAEHLRCR